MHEQGEKDINSQFPHILVKIFVGFIVIIFFTFKTSPKLLCCNPHYNVF